MRCAFNTYDPMGRGVIPASELSNVINLLNVTYSPNQVNTILQKAESVAGDIFYPLYSGGGIRGMGFTCAANNPTSYLLISLVYVG